MEGALQRFQLDPGRWAGWVETPASAPGWAASPVLVTGVTPLKTGHGRLAVTFLQPMLPGGGRAREVELRVLQREPRHLAATFKEERKVRTAVLAEPDAAWLESYCPVLHERRPIRYPSLLIDGRPLPATSVEGHLRVTFGADERTILHGAHRGSFGVELRSLPERRTSFMLNVECPPRESWYISRGAVPQEMEDKWFVFLEGGSLRFHRSWTGALIYAVEAAWRGDRLYLGQVTANRDPGEYAETDDRRDAAMLRYLIDVVLRGVPGSFPAAGDGGAALQARDAAGQTSL